MLVKAWSAQGRHQHMIEAVGSFLSGLLLCLALGLFWIFVDHLKHNSKYKGHPLFDLAK